MREANVLANWIMAMLPRHGKMTVAIEAPVAIGMRPIVHTLTPYSKESMIALIDANPSWIVGVFVPGADRETVYSSIVARYEEIEREAEGVEACRRG